MSDLDDFFAKQLEEEAAFSNRGKNWKQISKRLDAFDTGKGQGNQPRLRGWQLATVVAVVAAGFLYWKTVAGQHENKVLRQEIAALQSERSGLANQLELAEKQVAEANPRDLIKPKLENSERSLIPPTTQLKFVVKTPQNNSFNPEQQPIQATRFVEISPKKVPEEPLNQLLEEQFASSAAAEKTLPGVPALPQTISTAKDSTAVNSSDFVALLPHIDTLKKSLVQPDSLLAVEEMPKDSITTAPRSVPEIKPTQDSKPRFRIGAQALVGFVQPRQKGVSVLRGQGLTVETRVWRSLWVTGSVDWLHHEVSTDQFVPRFHAHHDSLPKPPDGGGGPGGFHHAKLVKVESAPRQQHFGIGIRYALPECFGLRPALRFTHNWVRVSPTLVTYKFEEDDPSPGPNPHSHEPEYTAEKFDAQWLNNQWRFGLGLEKDISSWTFGLWADYSKDFSAATPSFDAFYVRAGAQYRF